MNIAYQRGDLAVYVALLVVTMMLSAALIMSLILARQFRASGDVLESERAFYVASAGLEEALYKISKNFESNVTVDGEVRYVLPDSESAGRYQGQATHNEVSGEVCLNVVGNWAKLQRRFQLGPATCTLSGP